jgi:rod shape-determining protein MreD
VRTLFVGLPLLAVAAVLQSTVLPDFRVLSGGGLDLVLVLTLGWTLAGDWEGGIAWGFLGGLFLDLLSGGPLGTSALALVITAFVASLTEGQFWRSHVLLPLAAGLLGSLAYHLVTLVLLFLSGAAVDVVQAIGGVALPSTLINTLCIVPVYQVLRGLHALVYPAPVKM